MHKDVKRRHGSKGLLMKGNGGRPQTLGRACVGGEIVQKVTGVQPVSFDLQNPAFFRRVPLFWAHTTYFG